jgi:hypothetical protein
MSGSFNHTCLLAINDVLRKGIQCISASYVGVTFMQDGGQQSL